MFPFMRREPGTDVFTVVLQSTVGLLMLRWRLLSLLLEEPLLQVPAKEPGGQHLVGLSQLLGQANCVRAFLDRRVRP